MCLEDEQWRQSFAAGNSDYKLALAAWVTKKISMKQSKLRKGELGKFNW